jgi:hypothetical protein
LSYFPKPVGLVPEHPTENLPLAQRLLDLQRSESSIWVPAKFGCVGPTWSKSGRHC